MTTNWRKGTSRSMFLRLFWRTPRRRMQARVDADIRRKITPQRGVSNFRAEKRRALVQFLHPAWGAGWDKMGGVGKWSGYWAKADAEVIGFPNQRRHFFWIFCRL